MGLSLMSETLPLWNGHSILHDSIPLGRCESSGPACDTQRGQGVMSVDGNMTGDLSGKAKRIVEECVIERVLICTLYVYMLLAEKCLIL